VLPRSFRTSKTEAFSRDDDEVLLGDSTAKRQATARPTRGRKRDERRRTVYGGVFRRGILEFLETATSLSTGRRRRPRFRNRPYEFSGRLLAETDFTFSRATRSGSSSARTLRLSPAIERARRATAVTMGHPGARQADGSPVGRGGPPAPRHRCRLVSRPTTRLTEPCTFRLAYRRKRRDRRRRSTYSAGSRSGRDKNRRSDGLTVDPDARRFPGTPHSGMRTFASARPDCAACTGSAGAAPQSRTGRSRARHRHDGARTDEAGLRRCDCEGRQDGRKRRFSMRSSTARHRSDGAGSRRFARSAERFPRFLSRREPWCKLNARKPRETQRRRP